VKKEHKRTKTSPSSDEKKRLAEQKAELFLLSNKAAKGDGQQWY
jgi:hypothetical protein